VRELRDAAQRPGPGRPMRCGFGELQMHIIVSLICGVCAMKIAPSANGVAFSNEQIHQGIAYMARERRDWLASWHVSASRRTFLKNLRSSRNFLFFVFLNSPCYETPKNTARTNKQKSINQ
jgi:hypothetical protein